MLIKTNVCNGVTAVSIIVRPRTCADESSKRAVTLLHRYTIPIHFPPLSLSLNSK